MDFLNAIVFLFLFFQYYISLKRKVVLHIHDMISKDNGLCGFFYYSNVRFVNKLDYQSEDDFSSFLRTFFSQADPCPIIGTWAQDSGT